MMSITHTTNSQQLKAAEKIARDTEEFLSRGKEINQIPVGQSAYNLKIRAVENRGTGTRVAWEDPRMSMRSQEAKACSVKQIVEKKAQKKARKR